jgi:hypothetical protein
MHDVMASLQELRLEDVRIYSSGGTQIVAAPIAPAAAVAEPADESAIDENVVKPDEETFAAMRWASKLGDDANVLCLLRSLPKQIVEEQVQLYRKRDETAVAVRDEAATEIDINNKPRYHVRMLVAQRFHMFCHRDGIVSDKRMPYGVMKTFIQGNIEWKPKQRAWLGQQIRRWYQLWRSSTSNVLAAVAEHACPGGSVQSMLRSRAPKTKGVRKRAPGAGRPVRAPLIRQALYEWWSSIRYAIDWKQLMSENRSRGKKHLARFPRSTMKLKVNQFLQDHAHACLLNGKPVESLKPDSWWFRRWEEDYGLSMRRANRKYKVPRKVLKERLDFFWGKHIQDSAVHPFFIRTRSIDSQFRPIPLSSQ